MNIAFLPSATQFYNVATLSGYPAGSSLIITNHSSDPVFIVQRETQPLDTEEGYPLMPFDSCTLQSGDVELWVRGEGGPLVFQDPFSVVTPAGVLNPRVMVGLEALTVQSFIEANCKNGTQFEFTTYNALIPTGQIRDFVVITGSKPVLLKNRVFTFTGSELNTTIYRSPTYTGGTIVPYYNLSDINPAVGESVIRALPTVTNVGVQIASTFTLLGSIPQTGQSIISTQGENNVTGLERVLRPNTTYLFRTVNVGTDTKLFSKSTWYEGHLSSTAF